MSAFVIRFLESTVCKLPTGEISLFYPVSVAEDTSLKLVLPETPKTTRPKLLIVLTSVRSSSGRLYRQGVGSRLWIRHGRVSISVPAWHITPADVAGRPRWIGVGISQKH